MERRTWGLAAAISLLIAVLLPVPAHSVGSYTAAPAFDLTVTGPQGEATAGVILPKGAVPTQLRARVASGYTTNGSIVVSVGDRDVARVPARSGGRIRVPLSRADVRDASVALGLRVELDPAEVCSDVGDAEASLRNVRIAYQVSADRITSVASYMTPGPNSVTITTGTDPTAAEQGAALNAAAVAASLFGPEASIRYRPDAPAPSTPATQRVIRISEQATEPKAQVTQGVLVVSGPASSLTTSVLALSSDYLPIAGAPAAASPSASLPAAFGDLSQTLRELDIATPPLIGIGLTELTLPIDQSAFGRPVSGFTLGLRGSVTPAVAGQGRINVLWNDELVGSTPLTDSSGYTADISVGSAQTRRANTLTLQLEYEPDEGCRSGVLPARFDLSPESTVNATAGDALTGFIAMPQTLGAQTPVTFAGAVAPVAALADAIGVIVGLQRLTPALLDTELLDFDSFLDDPRPGIAVGVGPEQDAQLDAPLRYAPFRVVDGQSQRLSLQVDGSFAALQAYDTGERDLIVLGGTGDQAGELMGELSRRANTEQGGWASLVEDIAVAQPDQPIAFLSETGVAVQPEKIDESGILRSGWLLLAIAALLVAATVGFAVRLVRGRRHG